MATIDLLCFSDNHGQGPPLFVEAGATAWLFGGDYYNGPEIETYQADRDDPAAALLYPASIWQTDLPLVTVRGNHDTSDPWGFFGRSHQLNGSVHRLAGRLVVVGIGWHGERYYEIPLENDLRELCDAARRQVRRLVGLNDRVLLLTHYPPRLPEVFPSGAYENPGWYECLRQLAEELRPIAIIQGHNHRWHGIHGLVSFGGQLCAALQPGPAGARLHVDVESGEVIISLASSGPLSRYSGRGPG